jgi:hypothetical protein
MHERVLARGDGLKAGGAVGMDDRGDTLAGRVGHRGSHGHVRRVLAQGEEFTGAVGRDHGGERPEGLAELHRGVQPLDHPGFQGRGENRPIAQGAGSGFHPAPKESHDHSVGELVREEFRDLGAENLLAQARPGGEVEVRLRV